MNLIENEEVNARSKKSKNIMIIIIVLIILLTCLSAGLVYMIYDVQQNMTKLTIDRKQINSFAQDMFLIENDTVYISIKDFAKLVGYEVYNGDHTSEDATKGYIKNEYEEASYTLNSNKIYKTLLSEKDNEYYNLEKPIKMQNDKLYMSIEGMQIAATCAISYDAQNNQFSVFTLPYLAKYYTGIFNDSAVGDDKADFSNQKALLYNMIIVKNANNKYGVRSLSNQEIIGTKYTSIKFVESTKEFIVKTDDGKMGILSSTGITKIQPTYDEIKQIDKDLNLYLVKSNNKYGVINQNGNIVIYLEYDKIGIDTAQFTSNEIKNQYLLFDNCIAVQRDKKWGFFDKTGKLIAPIEYDSIGCVLGTQTSKTSNNLLIIPEYEAIVVGKDKKYGVVNSLGETYIKCVLDSLYSITTSGQDTYYMVQNDKTYEVIDYFEQKGIKKPQREEDIEVDASTSTTPQVNTNTVTENNTSGNTVSNEIIENMHNTVAVNETNNGRNNSSTGNTIPANNPSN